MEPVISLRYFISLVKLSIEHRRCDHDYQVQEFTERTAGSSWSSTLNEWCRRRWTRRGRRRAVVESFCSVAVHAEIIVWGSIGGVWDHENHVLGGHCDTRGAFSVGACGGEARGSHYCFQMGEVDGISAVCSTYGVFSSHPTWMNIIKSTTL